MAFITHRLGKTFYKSLGRSPRGSKGDSLPIICLHGGPGGIHRYFNPMAKLAKDRKIIMYDQIGSGRSTKLKKELQTVETLAEDLHRLIKKLKIKNFHLLGTSWGGTLALEYYFRYKGEGVTSLILQSPLVSTKDWSRDADRLIKTLSKRTQKTLKLCLEVGATDSKVYKSAEAEYYKRYVRRTKPDPTRAAYMKKFPNEHGGEVYNHMWGPSEFKATGTLKNYDRSKSLSKIKVPTVFICGRYDEATPESMKRYSRKIKGSRVAVIAGASHGILSEKPTAMLKVVSDFVASVEAK